VLFEAADRDVLELQGHRVAAVDLQDIRLGQTCFTVCYFDFCSF